MADASDTTRTPSAQQFSKLQSHIADGEPLIGGARGLFEAVACLSTCLMEDASAHLRAKHGCSYPHDATVDSIGLYHVLMALGDKLDAVEAWWTQLHKLGVVRAQEASHV
jgi:hypothetical protein